MTEGIVKTALKVIEADEGSVLHFIKSSDAGFRNFEEVYFSTVKKDSIKAWKLHQRMTLNLVVPVGRVLFYFIDARSDSASYNQVQSYVLSQDPYFRLTVPPMFWFGFKGLSEDLNLISNQADLEHDPGEVERRPLDAFDVEWEIHS
jgi:dTDP-4-dehydrorhamnose 3,5-epimerase